MVPIKRDLVRSNDFEQAHDENFSKYDYKTEIMPVNVLNGTKNPVLTSIKQRGNIKANNESVSVTADGTYTLTRTVPSNKKWIIKLFDAQKSGGTFTITNTTAYLYVDNIPVIVSSGTTTLLKEFSNDIELKAGSTISISWAVSGWSVSGIVYSRMIYQEFEEAQ